MTRAVVETYTGAGQPPYYEMIVENANPKITPPDFYVVATIDSTTKKTAITLKKEAQSIINCQVFYHREGINCWKATLAFFSKHQFNVSLVIIL